MYIDSNVYDGKPVSLGVSQLSILSLNLPVLTTNFPILDPCSSSYSLLRTDQNFQYTSSSSSERPPLVHFQTYSVMSAVLPITALG